MEIALERIEASLFAIATGRNLRRGLSRCGATAAWCELRRRAVEAQLPSPADRLTGGRRSGSGFGLPPPTRYNVSMSCMRAL